MISRQAIMHTLTTADLPQLADR